MPETVIKVDNLGKKYTINHQHPERYSTLRDVIVRNVKKTAKKIVSPLKTEGVNPSTEEFWALKDVSFEVQNGEVVGIIGRNGAGKSTLLKVLSRITQPSSGRVSIKGRVSSLLEVGTGFSPELTGRENIFLNGAILGMTHKEIITKFDEIVAFAEIEKFLDTPVKRYSSGMYVRLAFSVAAHLEPDILLIDEVLAVGDINFQKKCIGKVRNDRKEGRTVLLVSHNMPSILNICKRTILLDSGGIVASGESSDVIKQYMTMSNSHGGEIVWNDIDAAPGNEMVRLRAVRILQEGLQGPAVDVDISKDVVIQIVYQNLQENTPLYSAIWLRDKMGVDVLSSSNAVSYNLINDSWYGRPFPKGLYQATCRIPANFLNDGQYSITAIIGKVPRYTQILEQDVISFCVQDTGAMRKHGNYGKIIGVVRPRLAWETHPVS